MEQASTYRTEAMDGRHLPGLLALFDAAGSPCHCRFFHFDGDNNAWLSRCFERPAESRAELEAAVHAGSPEADGVVALAWGPVGVGASPVGVGASPVGVGASPVVGWAKLAPLASMKKRYEGRYYRGLPCFQGDREGGATLGCMLVHPDHRRRGVARALARGAIDLARTRGYRFVEAFPRTRDAELRDDERWTGPATALALAGFETVWEHEQYPVVKKTL